MSKYKFIGTEQDLIDNGFALVIDGDIKAIKRTNDYNVFVDKHSKVFAWREEHIQDLIDKGLVVEEKELKNE